MTEFWAGVREWDEMQKQVPFNFAQGRLSAPLKYASLRMTAFGESKKDSAGERFRSGATEDRIV
jgi:hypothetical protein